MVGVKNERWWLPSQSIAFTELSDKKFDQKPSGEKLDLSSPAYKFFTKIDDRGRIYVPAKLRRTADSFSFSADVRRRRIVLVDGGRYAVDSKGRVSIPADIRRSLGINSGDTVVLGLSGLPTKSLSRISDIEKRCLK